MSADSAKTVWNVPGAIEMARNLVDTPEFTLPVDIVKLARSLGVARVDASDISIDGYLGRGDAGELLIRYKASNPMTRNRFTIAHELGHILLHKASDSAIPESATRARNRCTDEERAANRVASELLMPHRAVMSRLSDGELSWERVRELSRAFDVSITAVSRRITEVSQRPTAIFWATVSDEQPGAIRAFQCATSRAHRYLFCQPPQREVQCMLHSLGSSEKYHPQASIDGAECLLQWDEMRVGKPGGAQHWFLCWELARR